MRKPCLLSAGLLVVISTSLWSQESLSLGEMARRLRAEKVEQPSSAQSRTTIPGSSLPPTVSTSSDAAAIRSQQQIEQFNIQIQKLLKEERFEELDRIADAERSTKERFPGGGWKLYGLYAELSKVPEGDESEWNATFSRLNRWISAKPESVTPRIALADLYLSYAWSARGKRYTDTVSDSGARLFQERTQQARDILDHAATLKEKCPHWYWVMQTVALAQGWSRPEAESLLQQAMAFEPDYYYFYQSHARYLLPKWYGEEGDSEAFANAIADKIGGTSGDIAYYKLVRDMVCDCSEQLAPQKVSWLRVKRGYALNQQAYGTSLHELNAFARTAIRFADADIADKLFTLIGENWDDTVWSSRRYFDECRSWAKDEIAERKSALNRISSAVEASLKTPQGKAYDMTIGKEFGQGFASVMGDCVKRAGDDLQDFTLYLQIGANGKVGAVVPIPATIVNACLAPKLYATTFSVPPEPAYWVRITMTIKP